MATLPQENVRQLLDDVSSRDGKDDGSLDSSDGYLTGIPGQHRHDTDKLSELCCVEKRLIINR